MFLFFLEMKSNNKLCYILFKNAKNKLYLNYLKTRTLSAK